VIYHNGALVNFVYPYERLKPANVLGTQEILSLASQTRTLPVHYISTLSVFSKSSYYGSQPIREEEEPKHIEGLRSGYVQSKWVAERLVTEARDRGLPVGIYRLGAVIGDSHTGVWSTDDYVSRFIKGCIQLGSIPDQDKMWQLTPVDYVAKVIVHLSRQPMSLGKAFHVLSPYHFHQSQLADWVCALGYELHRLPYNQWLAELKKVAQRSPEQALYPLLPVLAEEASLIEEELQFDSQNLLDGLAGTGITCPPVDVELLGTYFSYFIRSGFLEAPLPDGKLEHISKARAESS
jgi:thioester reductase-like protein